MIEISAEGPDEQSPLFLRLLDPSAGGFTFARRETAELGSCPTDATREGRSRRSRPVRKFAAMPTPERLRYQCRGSSPVLVVPYEPPCLLTVYIFRCAGAPIKSREAG